MPLFYHFTSTYHLPLIQAAGVITTTESNVGSPLPRWQPSGSGVGPPVVWLLGTPVVEHPHGLNGSYYDKRGARIAVDVPAIRWLDWEPLKNMNPKWKEALIEAGGGMMAATDWYIFPAPIRASRWKAIDLLNPDPSTHKPILLG